MSSVSSGAGVALGTAAAAALRWVEERSAGSALDRRLRVTLHFHPDPERDGQTLLRRFGTDRVYRSQFETGTSNGGLTAHPGGDRWRWESRMFGGAYDQSPPEERPTYGSLNHRRRAVGGSIRFGSAHFRLAEHVLDRATFCFPDSVFEPTDVGTVRRCRLTAPADAATPDLLDDYVEAQVHGPVILDRDVEALVLDPAYRDTDVAVAASDLGLPVEWHPGLRLHVDELAAHPGYRGEAVVGVGREVAVQGWLDAHVIGVAARRGSYDQQLLKQLWHCTARFGVAAARE